MPFLKQVQFFSYDWFFVKLSDIPQHENGFNVLLKKIREALTPRIPISLTKRHIATPAGRQAGRLIGTLITLPN